MVLATEDVNSTRPSPRSTIAGSSRLAKCTGAITLTAIRRELVLQRDVDEPSTVAEAGVQGGGGQRPAGRGDRLEHRLGRAGDLEVRPDRDDGGAVGGESGGGRGDVVLGGDHDVVVVGEELAGQLEADTAGRAGDQGERAGCAVGHGLSSVIVGGPRAPGDDGSRPPDSAAGVQPARSDSGAAPAPVRHPGRDRPPRAIPHPAVGAPPSRSPGPRWGTTGLPVGPPAAPADRAPVGTVVADRVRRRRVAGAPCRWPCRRACGASSRVSRSSSGR